MALDKSNSSLWVKVVIGIVAASFVLSLIPSVFGSGGASNTAQQPATTTGATGVAAINARYQPRVDAAEAVLKNDPNNRELLVTQGNSYFDWALEVRNASPDDPSVSEPIWLAATKYYERALKIKADDPAVLTDKAISHYYAGDPITASALAEKALKIDPKFAPALFNGAIFYKDTSKPAQALDLLQRYLVADPNGTYGDRAQAQAWVKELQ